VRQEPVDKRCISFIDGQNLYHCAREAFGCTYPNYDPLALSRRVCQEKGWNLIKVCFYTGVPDIKDDPYWHHFWEAKLASLGLRRVVTFSRPLRYANEKVKLPDGTKATVLAGREKGIDVRLALDVVRYARLGEFDVALIFSQDQDLLEVAREIAAMSEEYNRWMKVASAYPFSLVSRNTRGINNTDWIKIDRATYDACLDRSDYRKKK
jgi:uncharacterized LabA/DUF88 family protein